jgi:hypothetical protein
MVRAALFFETAAALFLRAGEINHSAGLQWEISGKKTGRTTSKIQISGVLFSRQRQKKRSEPPLFLKQRQHFFAERREQIDQQVYK